MSSFYIKISQFLSTRSDLVGENRAKLLQTLQYNVKFTAKKNLLLEISDKLRENLRFIEDQPIKSGSIALVYKGTFLNGKQIVIKIVKLQEKKILYNNLTKFEKLCKIIAKLPKMKRFSFHEMAREIRDAVSQETNMLKEAKNINLFRMYSSSRQNISAPFVYHEYTSENVLVMDFIEGETLLEICENYNNDTKEKMAKILLNEHLTQVYFDMYFHADLHHSNMIYNKAENILYFIDFGNYQQISRENVENLLEIIHAFLNKDYQKVAILHRKIGYIDKSADLQKFALEFQKIGEKCIKQDSLSIGEIFKMLIRMGQQFRMNLQPDLILIQKNMIMIEGVIKDLCKEINPLLSSKNFIDKLYIRYKISSLCRNFVRNFIKLFE